jgi:hypothetical protein
LSGKWLVYLHSVENNSGVCWALWCGAVCCTERFRLAPSCKFILYILHSWSLAPIVSIFLYLLRFIVSYFLLPFFLHHSFDIIVTCMTKRCQATTQLAERSDCF